MNLPSTVAPRSRTRVAVRLLSPTLTLVVALAATYGAGFGLEQLAGVA